MKKILIFGATSAIAQATARIWAKRGDMLFLVARNPEKLKAVTEDLKIRGAKEVFSATADLNQTEKHAELITLAKSKLGMIDTVLIAHGELGDPKITQVEYPAAEAIIQTNFLSPVSLLTLLANDMEQRKSGTLAVISSVAGDRGRGSNYVYGSTKAALTHFLGGLRCRLSKSGVAVVTIKPGFVSTPMTAHMKKGALWASPEQVGRGIVKAVDRGCNEVYLPGFWRLIMFVIRSIPEAIFKKMSL